MHLSGSDGFHTGHVHWKDPPSGSGRRPQIVIAKSGAGTPRHGCPTQPGSVNVYGEFAATAIALV